MIYLKKISVNNPSGDNCQIKEYKDDDVKTIEFLLSTGQWERVEGLKSPKAYSAPKKSKKKSK
tara:strand:- start:72 stop:260 length:189 start_codon:yes stop_codon:yes gene_type:complete